MAADSRGCAWLENGSALAGLELRRRVSASAQLVITVHSTPQAPDNVESGPKRAIVPHRWAHAQRNGGLRRLRGWVGMAQRLALRRPSSMAARVLGLAECPGQEVDARHRPRHPLASRPVGAWLAFQRARHPGRRAQCLTLRRSKLLQVPVARLLRRVGQVTRCPSGRRRAPLMLRKAKLVCSALTPGKPPKRSSMTDA